MSFSARETSRHLGQPDTLFRFEYGTQTIAYTDAEREIDLEGVTYRPIPIQRNAITSSGTLDKATININLPINTEIAELFRVFPPSDVVGVTIYQSHDGEKQFLAMFVGRVLSCGRKGRVATLACEPASTSIRRPGLRRRWQYGCPHVLYGPQCRASRAAFTYTRTVASVDRAFVTMPSGWQGSNNRSSFENGLIEWDGPNGTEVRNILQVNNDTLTISGRVSGLATGSSVRLSLGCKHTMGDCRVVFNNIQNYGGDPWIPLKNPVGLVNHFY